MIVQYLKNVGDDEEPCWVPCAKNDDGAVPFMAKGPVNGEQVSDLLTVMAFLHHLQRTDIRTPKIHGGIHVDKAIGALKSMISVDDLMYERLRKAVLHEPM
jgi:hypothetical protein